MCHQHRILWLSFLPNVHNLVAKSILLFEKDEIWRNNVHSIQKGVKHKAMQSIWLVYIYI